MTTTGARSRAAAGTEVNRFARQLFDGLPARYDTLSYLLSFGQDRRWRRAMVDSVLACRPALVLDVATGPAGVALQVARRSGARVVGADITPEMLAMGSGSVERLGFRGRVLLVQSRAEELPFPDGSFDALTFTYLLRYVADPAATLVELARVVKPGGVIASLEFYTPGGPVLGPLWTFYTRGVLPAAGLLGGGRDWWDVGRFLGPSISEHYRRFPLAWHHDAWVAAGVEQVRTRVMSLGGGVVMWGRRSGA